MKTLFIATSPLHILISTLIASSMNKDECNLVICGKNKERNKELSFIMSKWPNSPFHETTSLNNSKKPSDFKKTISQTNPSQIIIGNDLIPEFYSIAHIAKQKKISLVYMDDGLHSYIEYDKKLPSKSLHVFYNIIRRVIKGYFKPYPHTLGSSPLTDKSFLLFPELAKENVKHKICTQIVINSTSRNLLSDMGNFFVNKLNLTLPSSEKVALFILPHHSRISIPVGNQFRDRLKKFTSDGMTVLIKNHPSNDDSIIKDIIGFSSSAIVEIPKILPIEILICVRSPDIIIGGLSSIFLTTRALQHNVEFELVSSDLKSIPLPLSKFLNFANDY
jgi:hypothetical protein